MTNEQGTVVLFVYFACHPVEACELYDPDNMPNRPDEMSSYTSRKCAVEVFEVDSKNLN